MSQTAHDSPARNVTSGRLELLRREELNVTHLVHRQADILVPEFGENHGALVRSAATSEADRQVDHRDDGTTQIDQPPHVRRRAGQPRRVPERDDLTDGANVTAVHGPGDCEQQQSQRAW
jgi:hypothetical protein